MSLTFNPDPPGFRPPAPEPRATPLGPIGMLRVLRRNPIETWTQAHFEKPILTGRSILGDGAVISEPAAIRRVLLDNADNYRKDLLQRRILAPGLGDGLLTTEGDAWRKQRRTLAPLFTPRTVAGFARTIETAADALVARLGRRREGTQFDMQREMARVTLDVLGKTLFSDGLGRDPEAFMSTITSYFDTIGRLDPVDLLDFPEWVPRINRIRSRPALQFFADAVEALMVKRKRLLAQDAAAVPRDILTLLLEAQDPQTGTGLTDHEVRANIVTFIGAGHETTANSLTWALFLLSRSDAWQDRLAAEAKAHAGASLAAEVENLVATRAVIEEAMRLYPPVASLSRMAMGPDDLAGRRIRKGALVMIAPWVLHRHRRLWADPDLFDPSRFLPGAREKIDRFAYLPFGAGPRVCIGAAFALQEATIILAALMRRFQAVPVRGHEVIPVQRITLRPKGGMPLRLVRRP